MKTKPIFVRLIKIVISIGLIVLILSKIDLTRTLEVSQKIDPLLLLIPFGILIINNGIRTFRWYMITIKMDNSVHWFELFKINYIALFFNTFLPGRFGGDLIKIYYMAKNKSEFTLQFSISIITDRIIGIVGFIILSVFSLSMGYKILPLWLISTVTAIDVFIIGFLLISSNQYILSNIKFLQKIIKRFNIQDKIDTTHRELSKIKKNYVLTLQLISITIVAHVFFIFSNYAYAWILGFKISLWYFLIFIPLISTVTLLPISINGLGIRESLVLIMFTTVGLTVEEAFVLGVLSRLVSLTHNCIGGIFYMLDSSKPPRAPGS